MFRWIGRILLVVTLAHTAWVEWAVLTHAGIMWGLFFGMFFVPFALSATLGLERRESA